MAKLVYVTVDPSIPPVREGETNFLVKGVNESYLGGTFRDVIQHILDPARDEYNEGYNAHDSNLAAKIQGWFNEMNTNPNQVKVDVAALSNNEPPQEIRVGLNDIISDYTDRILQTKERVGESGEKNPYRLIDLCVRKNVPGGYRRTIY